MRVEESFFYVAMTTPFFALIPSDVYPLATAARAFSIWGNFPKIIMFDTFSCESGEWKVAHSKDFKNNLNYKQQN